MTTLWDTTGTAVVKELAAERRTGGAVLSGVALTLVVVVDESRVAEAEEAATHAAETHPCRLLVVVRRQIDAPAPRLDAEVVDRRAARPRRGRRHADVRPAGAARRVGRAAAAGRRTRPSSPGGTPRPRTGSPPTRSAVFADRRITDSSIADDPLAALRTRADDYAPGDTDLAWTRSTAVAGDPRLQPGLGRPAGAASRCASRRPGRGRPGQRRPRSCSPAGCPPAAAAPIAVEESARTPGPSGVDVRRPRRWTRTRRCRSTPTAAAAPSSPSRTGPTPPWRCRSARSATCSARSCAGWTPTSPTATRWRRRPASTGLADRSPNREHVWLDPAEADERQRASPAPKKRAAAEVASS